MGRTTTPPKTRAPLSRDRIAEAALHIMDTEGLDAVSMRRVAREVGVEAMSLYHHVRDKDDLLNGVIE
jgi:AcrR family transcriptional regulator